ncbi:hypothetical protein Tco_0045984 [Tanacetum coccineum]
MNVCDLEEERRERSLDNNSYVSDQDMCFRKKDRSNRIFGKRKSDFEMGGPVFIGDKKVAVAGGGIIMDGENIDNLTMEQYLTLTGGNQALAVVRAEIGGNVNFEIKSQFNQELREDTFS